MAELISIAANYPSTEFDTLIPELTDIADIREAFLAYHFGVSSFDGSTDTPAAESIHGHIKALKNLLEGIAASAVLTLSGTANEVIVSGSAGYVTVGLPDDVTITDDLIVGGDLSVTANLTITGESVMSGGFNIFGNTTARNNTISSPVEGILTYIASDNQFTVYDGSSWVGIENHGSLGGRIDNTEVLALLGL